MFATLLSAIRTRHHTGTANARRRRPTARLGLESLEDRLVLSGGAPPAPVFTASPYSASQVNLSWQSVPTATSYQVEIVSGGRWVQLGSLSGSSTGCAVTGLSANTTYDFDVVASNAYGSNWGVQQFATTLGSAPGAPAFTATPYSSSQVNLSWQSVPGAASYQVEIVSGGRWVQLGSLSGSSTGCAVTGLSANTTYDFDVVASNAYGSNWGIQQFATTGIAVDHPAAATAYSPVSGTLFGSNGPSYLDVKQGGSGDCWLLASLAEVAARDPQDIYNMFTSAGTTVENGVVVSLYNVRFFENGTARYVTVDTELPSGGQYYDQPVNGVLWVALAEKAYAQANGAGWVTSGDEGSDSYNALNEGFASWALSAITGMPAGDFVLTSSTNLAADWDAGDLIVLGSDTNPSSSDIVGSHAYAVVGYNASSSKPFQMFNPWGTNSSGWVMENATGQWVYGLFNANQAFLVQNYLMDSLGSGSANPIADLGIGSIENAGPGSVALTDGSVPTRFVRTGNKLSGPKPQTSTGSAGQSYGTLPVDPSLIDAILMDAGSLESANPSAARLALYRARMI